MSFIKLIKNKVIERKKNALFQQKWRETNKHNYTYLANSFPDTINANDIVEIGKASYGYINVKWFWNKQEHLRIGSFCSIAEGVVFLTGGNHTLDTLSTFPFDYYYDTGVVNTASTKGSIVVEDDVWIGMNSIILSGVTIGQGAVIGAGSVVAKDVPPYAIYVDNKIVKYRFSDDIIEKLLKFDFSSLSSEDIINYHRLLKERIDLFFFETDFYKSHLKDDYSDK